MRKVRMLVSLVTHTIDARGDDKAVQVTLTDPRGVQGDIVLTIDDPAEFNKFSAGQAVYLTVTPAAPR